MREYFRLKVNEASAMALQVIEEGATEKELAKEFNMSEDSVRRYFRFLEGTNPALWNQLKKAQKFRAGLTLYLLVKKHKLSSEEIVEKLGERGFETSMKQLYNYDKRLYIIVRTRFYNESR